MEKEIIITIALMSVVTLIPRLMPAWILGNKTYPRRMVLWLKYIPVAVISSLLAPELFLRDQKFDISWSNQYFWVALPTFIVGLKTKNLFYTILTGMGSLAFLRYIFS